MSGSKWFIERIPGEIFKNKAEISATSFSQPGKWKVAQSWGHTRVKGT